MPLYDMHCPLCSFEYELVIKLDEKIPPCPQCCHDSPSRKISAPKIARVEGPKGAIFSEKQVEATYGKNWRNPQNHTRPGGDRKKLYF